MSIMVATPMYGGQCTRAYFESAMNLRADFVAGGFPHRWLSTRNESLITRARNTSVATFLKSEFEALMFIDADIEFETEDVGKLWALNVPVACGVYPMKWPGAPYAAWHRGKLVEDLDRFKRPIEVDYAGTGFLLIRRGVFEALKPVCQEMVEGKVGKCWGFFSQMFHEAPDGETIELSEDYAFCERWRSIGGKIVMDPSVRLKHHGTFAYG